VISSDLVTLQSRLDSPWVFGAVGALDRKRVLEAEVIENFLAAFLEFVNEVAIIQGGEAWMSNGVTGKLVSSVRKRDQLFPSNT